MTRSLTIISLEWLHHVQNSNIDERCYREEATLQQNRNNVYNVTKYYRTSVFAQSPNFSRISIVRIRMATMWAPKEDGLRQIIELLKESQSSDTAVQRQVQQVNS